jgi:hypothetical protein
MHFGTTTDFTAVLTSWAIKAMLCMVSVHINVLHMVTNTATAFFLSFFDCWRRTATIYVSRSFVFSDVALFWTANTTTGFTVMASFVRVVTVHFVMSHMPIFVMFFTLHGSIP